MRQVAKESNTDKDNDKVVDKKGVERRRMRRESGDSRRARTMTD